MRYPTCLLAALVLCALVAVPMACDSGGANSPRPDPPPGEWKYLGLGGENVSDIESIAVHPEDPDVIYVGSGFDFSNGIQGKLFKTTDGGATWDTLLVGGSYLDIEIDPQDPKTVYALPGGIVKSTDGGETWTVISRELDIPTADKFAKSLAIDLQNPEVLYAGLGGFFGGCPYKSADGGESWNRLIPTDERSGLCNGVTSLTIDPTAPNTVYAGTAFVGEVFKSTDAGETWNRSLENESGIVFFIRFAPTDRIIFAGISRTLYRSSDSGASWKEVATPDSVGGGSAIAFGRNGKRYLATRKGIFLSRAGSGWVEMRTGLPHRGVKEVVIGPAGRRLYAGLEPSYAGDDEHGLYTRDLTTTEDTSK